MSVFSIVLGGEMHKYFILLSMLMNFHELSSKTMLLKKTYSVTYPTNCNCGLDKSSEKEKNPHIISTEKKLQQIQHNYKTNTTNFLVNITTV